MKRPRNGNGHGNNTVYADYATYYDTFYAEKKYDLEVDRVIELCNRYRPSLNRVLDMGCGTGRHMEVILARGFGCDGFDLSQSMIDQAKRRLEGADCRLRTGDIRNYRSNRKYDLVVSMFAAMGYLAGVDALVDGLRTARHHLARDGLFIFDGWFGPAVYRQLPETREHRYTIGDRTIIRHVTPELDLAAGTVTAHYTIEVQQAGRSIDTIRESHVLRPFFPGEVALAARAADLEVIDILPFPDIETPLDLNTWNAVFILKPRPDRR